MSLEEATGRGRSSKSEPDGSEELSPWRDQQHPTTEDRERLAHVPQFGHESARIKISLVKNYKCFDNCVPHCA